MKDRGDQPCDVLVIETGDGVTEVDGEAVGQAGGDPQHPLLTSGAGKTRSQGGDHGGLVHHGDLLPGADGGVDGDEPAGEVISVEPGLVDEELGGGFEAVKPLGMGPEPGGEHGR